MLLNQAPIGPVWWLGLGLSATFLVLILLAEYTVVDAEDHGFRSARLSLTLLAYLVLLAILGWIRFSGARAAISATAGALVAGAVSFRLLRLYDVSTLYALSSATIVALVLGQSVWAINYWFIHPLGAGLLLLDVFYVVHGLLQQNADPPRVEAGHRGICCCRRDWFGARAAVPESTGLTRSQGPSNSGKIGPSTTDSIISTPIATKTILARERRCERGGGEDFFFFFF